MSDGVSEGSVPPLVDRPDLTTGQLREVDGAVVLSAPRAMTEVSAHQLDIARRMGVPPAVYSQLDVSIGTGFAAGTILELR